MKVHGFAIFAALFLVVSCNSPNDPGVTVAPAPGATPPTQVEPAQTSQRAATRTSQESRPSARLETALSAFQRNAQETSALPSHLRDALRRFGWSLPLCV